MLRATGLLLNNLVQGGIDVARHSVCVAADVEIGAVLQPLEQFGRVLEHSMLYIEFLDLIARESGGESCECPVANESFEFFAVQEVCSFVLVPEQKPRFALCPRSATIVKESAEWRDPCTGADHDQRTRGILREAKVFIGVNEDGQRCG